MIYRKRGNPLNSVYQWMFCLQWPRDVNKCTWSLKRSLHDSVVSFVPPRSSNSNHLLSHSLAFFSLNIFVNLHHLLTVFYLPLCLPIPKSSLWRNCLEHARLWQVRDAHHVPLGATANLQIILPQTLLAPCIRSYPQSVLRQVLSSPLMSSSDWIPISTVTRLVSW